MILFKTTNYGFIPVYETLEEYEEYHLKVERIDRTTSVRELLNKALINPLNQFYTINNRVRMKVEVLDYLHTNNGYIVPVIKYEAIYRHLRTYHILTLPNNNKGIVVTTLKDGEIFTPDYRIYFYRDIKPKPRGYNYKFIYNMIMSGVPLIESVALAYPNANRASQLRIASEVINEELIRKYIKIEDKMNLKESLLDVGISTDYISKKIKSILDDPKETKALKQFALQTAINILEKPDLEHSLTINVQKKSLSNVTKLQEIENKINLLDN